MHGPGWTRILGPAYRPGRTRRGHTGLAYWPPRQMSRGRRSVEFTRQRGRACSGSLPDLPALLAWLAFSEPKLILVTYGPFPANSRETALPISVGVRCEWNLPTAAVRRVLDHAWPAFRCLPPPYLPPSSSSSFLTIYLSSILKHNIPASDYHCPVATRTMHPPGADRISTRKLLSLTKR